MRWPRSPRSRSLAEMPATDKPNSPAGLYNAMIHPLVPYAIRGAIWYQGESNAGRAYEYRTLFPTMIKDWRAQWGEGDFPFLLVQLAPFMKIDYEPKDCAWAELRDAQLFATHSLPAVGMAVITDVGQDIDIHPKWKAPVGARLALAARALAYGEKVPYSGPEYYQQQIDGNRVTLSFKHTDGGLVAQGGGALYGFTDCRRGSQVRQRQRGDSGGQGHRVELGRDEARWACALAGRIFRW